MSKPIEEILAPKPEASAEHGVELFGRVVSILEQAHGNIVRVVNTQMVLAYWLIGREIVQHVQGGEGRAEYGKKSVEDLSLRLTERYGKGFSATNLWYFRQFYLAFQHRIEIPHPAGGESSGPLHRKKRDRGPLLGAERPQADFCL